MSVMKHFVEKGIELSEDNSLPAGQRSQKNFKRVIAAVRAAESEMNDELRQANDRCRKAQENVIELQQRCHQLEAELKRFRVNESLQALEVLTVKDRTKLLELASA